MIVGFYPFLVKHCIPKWILFAIIYYQTLQNSNSIAYD